MKRTSTRSRARADAVQLAASTADAAFVTSLKGEIVAWNRAATRLLGYRRDQAVGAACHTLLGGTDLFSNPFCDAQCTVKRSARRCEGVHPFQVDVRTASGTPVRVRMTVLIVQGARPDEPVLLHVLSPCHEPLQTPSPTASSAGSADVVAGLSRREIEVLLLLAEGASTHEIAQRLFIAATTVRNHTQRILAKLNVRTRLAAVAAARRAGILG